MKIPTREEISKPGAEQPDSFNTYKHSNVTDQSRKQELEDSLVRILQRPAFSVEDTIFLINVALDASVEIESKVAVIELIAEKTTEIDKYIKLQLFTLLRQVVLDSNSNLEFDNFLKFLIGVKKINAPINNIDLACVLFIAIRLMHIGTDINIELIDQLVSTSGLILDHRNQDLRKKL
jgi:hypothetical protein